MAPILSSPKNEKKCEESKDAQNKKKYEVDQQSQANVWPDQQNEEKDEVDQQSQANDGPDQQNEEKDELMPTCELDEANFLTCFEQRLDAALERSFARFDN